MSETTQICLEEFEQPWASYVRAQKYAFQLGDSLSLSKHPCRDSALHPQGVFSNCKTGLSHRTQIQLALFSVGDSLRLAINGKLYNLSHDGIVAKRKCSFFGLHEFQLRDGGKILFRCKYWSAGEDFFEYCERVTHSVETRKTYLLIWNRIASGQEITETELREIEQSLTNPPENLEGK
jgi:hypothetical protein